MGLEHLSYGSDRGSTLQIDEVVQINYTESN